MPQPVAQLCFRIIKKAVIMKACKFQVWKSDQPVGGVHVDRLHQPPVVGAVHHLRNVPLHFSLTSERSVTIGHSLVGFL